MQFQILTFLFQIVVMVLLFAFLRAKAFKPIMKLLKDRQTHIENQIADAERSREEAAALVKRHEEMLAQSKKEASALLESARRTGEQQAATILEAAQEEAKRIKQDAVADIAREKELALAELRDQVGSLSVALAEKILAREINAATHKALVDQAVSEMGELIC